MHCSIYIYIYIYIYRSAMRCAKFGVAVCKASMLNWRRGSICHWYSGMQSIYARLKGAIGHGYMCIVLYIYIDLP